MTTPYEGNVYVWHWKGDSLSEQSIEDVARTLKQWAPNVTGIFVKTSDGSDWMGKYDTDTELRIDGPASIARWVQVLGANNLEFHAWCVAKGDDFVAEADIIVETALVPGVKSVIIDVESHPGFWSGSKEDIEPFMKRVRRGVGGTFHLSMSVDPRPHQFEAIHPEKWRPFFDSVLPQAYWDLFERPFEEVLDEVFDTWGDYGLPLYPVLQANAPIFEMEAAFDYANQFKDANSISWWRLGVIGPQEFAVVNTPIKLQQPEPEEPPPLGGDYGIEILVTPEDPRFQAGTFTGENVDELLKSLRGTWGWRYKYKATSQSQSTVWGRWNPQLSESGWYEVAVFVPSRFATTTNARYKLHGVKNQSNEILHSLSQEQYRTLWVPLGIYQFDASNPNAGVIFLNDLTGEADKSIAFDAVRYRQIIGRKPGSQYLADGYDPPIGSPSERSSAQVWPGNWFDATGYAKLYNEDSPNVAYHTGADLNLNSPYFDADAHTPVSAAASGIVTFAGKLATWGKVVVIRHDPLVTTGKVMYGRYAHVEGVRVKTGDRVQRGQQIANVGNADGLTTFHLHFDLSPTERLATAPWDWPRLNLERLQKDYVDPRAFIEKNRPT